MIVSQSLELHPESGHPSPCLFWSDSDASPSAFTAEAVEFRFAFSLF